jgi:small subunit ribosomal protein S3
MGQKVNPIGFRLPVTRDWASCWYASEKEFADFLYADQQIRNWLKKKLKTAAVSRIVIERAWNSVRVTIFTARPGIVIGRPVRSPVLPEASRPRSTSSRSSNPRWTHS